MSVGGAATQPFPWVFDKQFEDEIFDFWTEEVRHEWFPVEDAVRDVLLSIAVSLHREGRSTWNTINNFQIRPSIQSTTQ